MRVIVIIIHHQLLDVGLSKMIPLVSVVCNSHSSQPTHFSNFIYPSSLGSSFFIFLHFLGPFYSFHSLHNIYYPCHTASPRFVMPYNIPCYFECNAYFGAILVSIIKFFTSLPVKHIDRRFLS